MRIDIITAIPSLLVSPFNDSIIKRAQEKKLVEINIHNLRDFSTHKQKSIDDYAFGGGAGMVLSIEPIYNFIQHLQKKVSYDEIIFMTPDGDQLDQNSTNQLSLKKKYFNSLWTLQRNRSKSKRLFNYQRNYHWRLCSFWWRITSSSALRRNN